MPGKTSFNNTKIKIGGKNPNICYYLKMQMNNDFTKNKFMVNLIDTADTWLLRQTPCSFTASAHTTKALS
jgi:hypothetical protein